MPKYFIANWKMNQRLAASGSFMRVLSKESRKTLAAKKIIICPSFPLLGELEAGIKKVGILLGAQDVSARSAGSFTGEVSAAMLKDVGVRYVIVGHSERRINWQESDQLINSKIKELLKQGMVPILCLGETREQRKKKITNRIIKSQLTRALKGVSLQQRGLLVAYEPVWAISSKRQTLQFPLASQIKEITFLIRGIINNISGAEQAKESAVLYGGSVNKNNMSSLVLASLGVDGFLIGNASLKATDFLQIVKHF